MAMALMKKMSFLIMLVTTLEPILLMMMLTELHLIILERLLSEWILMSKNLLFSLKSLFTSYIFKTSSTQTLLLPQTRAVLRRGALQEALSN